MNPKHCKFTNLSAFRLIMILATLGSSGFLNAQNSGVFFGKVLDARSHKPIPFASIFLANTMLGVNTDDRGDYRIEKIPPGKYDITVSSVGYVIRQVSAVMTTVPIELNIELNEDVRELKEVTVKGRRFDYKKWRDEFKRRFVGTSANARDCKILNLDSVNLDYDDDARLFTASCQVPLAVENLALGYKLYYHLVEFSVNYKSGVYVIAGIPRFEELPPKNEKQVTRWRKQRDKSYYGSMNHFVRSLKAHQLKNNKFEVYGICKTYKEKVNIDSLFSRTDPSQFEFKCLLEIDYTGGFGRKVSDIKLMDGVMKVYDNGYYENPLRVEMWGEYALHENVAAELLPLEYQPIPQEIK